MYLGERTQGLAPTDAQLTYVSLGFSGLALPLIHHLIALQVFFCCCCLFKCDEGLNSISLKPQPAQVLENFLSCYGARGKLPFRKRLKIWEGHGGESSLSYPGLGLISP